MKTIKSVQYFELDVTDPLEVECRVTYVDDTQEMFITQEELERVKQQMYRQSKSVSDPLHWK